MCRGCGEVLPRSYWRADGDVVCERCAEERRGRDRAEARRCLERGLVFGWIAAVAGAFGQAGAWGLIAQMDVGEDAWILRAYLQDLGGDAGGGAGGDRGACGIAAAGRVGDTGDGAGADDAAV